jgi:hypothetical protein
MPYFRSDRNAAMRLVWTAYFSDLTVYYSTMIELQQSTACCGFGPPQRCINDSRPYPQDLVIKRVSTIYLGKRLECGHIMSNEPRFDYYQATSNCLEYYDPTTTPKTIGGCKYDLGIGSCIINDPDAYTSGCASTVEDYMQSKLSPLAFFIIASGAINSICIILCFIMYWKRKYTDVFPSYEQELANNKVYIY